MRICEVYDCEKRHYAKGFCSPHYQRYRVTGSPEPEPTRTCNLCDVEMPTRSYGPHISWHARDFKHTPETISKIQATAQSQSSERSAHFSSLYENYQNPTPFIGARHDYWLLHRAVETVYGKPNACDWCFDLTANRYEWANLTGDYYDETDYARLCSSCHKTYDWNRGLVNK